MFLVAYDVVKEISQRLKLPTSLLRAKEVLQADANSGPVFGRVENVSKSFAFDSGNALLAVESISCSFKEGELVAFLGPSGCGKTTLLRMAGGLTPPTSGRIEIGGETILEPQDKFAFVFQSPTLLPWRTVLDNVLFPLEIKGTATRETRNRADELLTLVGLSDFGGVRPHQLSGGMKQRVALCRALVQEPSLILMDEPFGALDELTRMEMHDLLLRIRAVSRATVLFVTHSIPEAIYLSDQVLIFSKRPGRIVDEITVRMPYPRNAKMRYTPEFSALERRASAALGVIHD
jgi:NitT/TauT family transport system ATP-binding protein